MKWKMITITSVGNTVVLPHLPCCTHFKRNTELEIMQRRTNRVLHSMEWLSVKRHLMTTFWLAEEVIEEDMNGMEKNKGGMIS